MSQNFCNPKILSELESEMKTRSLWQTQPPSAQALASTQPFSIDTLQPAEWLQWVFIPKITQLNEQGLAISQPLNISPYFEQCWSDISSYSYLIELIKRLEEEK